MRRYAVAALACGCSFVAFAQRGVDWVVGGNDAHRSSWVRMDAKINAESMKKPGFELLWKLKLNGTPRQMSSSYPPSLLDFYISYRGFRSLGFVSSASGVVTGIDIDLARVEWEKSFAQPAGLGTVACPGGITSGVVRTVTTLNYPPPVSGSGIGRGTPAKGGVGEAGEGAVTLKPPTTRPAPPPPPPPTRPGTRAGAPVNLFAPRIQWANFITGDGKFHSLYVSNGDEPNAALDFLPANAHAIGLMVFERVAYAATINDCGGVDNGLWALDLDSKAVTHWKAPGNVVGPSGFALAPDGTIYVSTTKGVSALELKTLAVKGNNNLGGQAATSSPLIFDYKGKDLLAVTTADGKLQLLDLSAPANAPVSTESFAAKEVGSLASWQDMSGVRWIFAPSSDSIVAWKVGDGRLEKAWTSRKMTVPVSPIVVNGVVFALDAGTPKTGKAVLYALDAVTGKDTWNSGSTLPSYVTTGRLAAGGSRVYVATHDGTQYAFGFPIEH